MDTVQLGQVTVTRFIIGSNPFSGFSHQGSDTDVRMKRYFTAARIKATLYKAEALGVNTVLGRTDHHVMRLLSEYWDEGGTLQWFGQTCPEAGPHDTCVARAASGKAKGLHIHGGLMDYLFAQNQLDEIPRVIDAIRGHGIAAGVAAHNPKVIEWAEEHLDVDYYMCSYYNANKRDERAEHVSGMPEWFHDDDRQAMATLIQGLSKPAIHYKVMAAGRNDPREALSVVARSMRPGDATCIGIYDEGKPDMLREDVALFLEALRAEGKA